MRHALFALLISVAFDAAAQHIAWRTYGLREGLTNLSIRALQQGRDGELWVGTDNGLFHFDGQRFTPVEAPGTSEVYALALSPEGELWAMSANGAVVRQTAAERFEPVDIGSYERLVRPPGLAFTTQGEVYLLQSAGLVRGTRTNGRWHFELVVRDAITALAVVGDRVRFASGSLLKEYSPAAGVRSLTESAGLPLEPWKCLGHDPEGHLWVRGAARLFDVAPDAKGSVDRSAEVSTSSKTCTLSFDRQHHVYVPSDEGLSMVGPTRTLRFDPAHGFPASTVITSLVDSDGALWVGSFGLGLVRPLGSGVWLGWQHADGLSHNSVWAILPTSSGTTWVGTTRGLNVIDAEMRIVRSIGVAEGLPGAWVGALIETNEHEIIAATSPAALTRLGLDGTVLGRTEAGSGLFGDRLDALAIDREGRLWVAGHRCWRSREPVARGRPLSFELVTVPGLPADQTFRHVLVDRRGVVWLSGSAGLSRFDGAAWQHLTEADGLASGNVAAVSEDETGLWVSYREPLGLTHLVDGPTRGLTPLALPKRLAAYATATDATGRLWVSTDNGVWVRENGAWQHFDTEDGLVWDDGNDLALATDARGRVWVGTSNGLACLTANTARAPLPIARVISAEGDDGPLDVRHSLVLPWSRRGLRLRFGTVNLLAETRTRFRYRLAGYEEAWHETTDRSLQYLDLPPGTYRFELLAGAPGGWSATPAHVDFRVEPPWWRTWWAMALAVALVAAALRGVVRLRLRRIEAQKRELEELVTERTAEARAATRAKSAFLANMSHEIRTPMNAVIGLTDLLTTMSLPPEAQSSLSTIRASGEALLSIISDVLDYSKIESGHLQLEQRDLDLDQLVDDSVAVAVATARGKPLEFDVRLGADVPRTIVSDAVRVRQVLLNLLSNAVKFTPHGTIRVTVARGATGGEGVALHFSVEDQGIGLTEQAMSQLFKEFTQADASTTRRFGGTGLGLAISKRLVEALGGRIWVESTPGRGSTFHFTIIAASAAAAPPVAPFQAALLGAEADFKGLAERLARLGVPVVNVTQPSEVQAGTFVFVGRSAAGAVASLRAAGVARVIGVGEVEGADAQVRRPWSTRALSDLGGQGVKTTPGVAATHRLDVLVADDNVVNQRVSVALLESLGHRVDVVGDGEQAVKAVSTKHYDVVLMDVQMPVVDGLEATRRLRQAGLRLPILALTASASTEDEAGCRNAGMTDFLSKPVRLGQLKAKLGAMTPAAK